MKRFGNGSRRERRTGNGATSSYAHDAIGRLSSLAHDLAGTAADHSLGFTRYNPASQVATRTSSNDAYASDTAYDVNRAYTANGLNQYIAAGPATFAYDANGNLISDGSTNFTYDVENRLVAASGAHTAALRYDPLGRLYEVGAATPSRRFVWDDALVARYSTSGTANGLNQIPPPAGPVRLRCRRQSQVGTIFFVVETRIFPVNAQTQ